MNEQKRSFDDFDAVKQLVMALENFSDDDRKRIVRWAFEKLGTIYQPEASMGKPKISEGDSPLPMADNNHTNLTIKDFLDKKNPQNGTHFAVVVAYYYRFEAPDDQKKDVIGSGDLNEAARLASRQRLNDPGKVLYNAYNQSGFLDQVSHGKYKINTVGENLVAMVLPGNDSTKKVSIKKSTRKVNGKTKLKKKK